MVNFGTTLFYKEIPRSTSETGSGGPREVVDKTRQLADSLIQQGNGMVIPGFGEIIASREDIGQFQPIVGSSPNVFHSGERVKTGNYHTYLCRVMLADGRDGRDHVKLGLSGPPTTYTEGVSELDMENIIGIAGEEAIISGLGLQEGDVLIGKSDGDDRLSVLVIRVEDGKLQIGMDYRPDMAGFIL